MLIFGAQHMRMRKGAHQPCVGVRGVEREPHQIVEWTRGQQADVRFRIVRPVAAERAGRRRFAELLGTVPAEIHGAGVLGRARGVAAGGWGGRGGLRARWAGRLGTAWSWRLGAGTPVCPSSSVVRWTLKMLP
mgnify:CR=1 FL=1